MSRLRPATLRAATLCAAALATTAPLLAQNSAAPPAAAPAPAPSEIVAAAPAGDWVRITADDLIVMTLSPGAGGRERRIVIQLVAQPFARPWVANIRTLARAHWWDGLAVVRVQDNYVAQWGDPDGEDAARARPLPAGLLTTGESGYTVDAQDSAMAPGPYDRTAPAFTGMANDPYGTSEFFNGWPVASAFTGTGLTARTRAWPVHCYGIVGVGRGMSPDAGTGAELYTVIGHAPRHLDRNIAVVGRVIEGIEHLSSLPRGTGPLGFYETPGERTTILSIRTGDEAADLPAYEYLSTGSDSFRRYAEARANRRDPFFIVPAGGADICNIPVPVRRVQPSR